MTKRKAGSTKPPVAWWTDREVNILAANLHLTSEEIVRQNILPGRTVASLVRKRRELTGCRARTGPAPNSFSRRHASVWGYAQYVGGAA